MSHARLCAEHSFQGFSENLEQLRAGSGPYFEHWARRVLLSAHRRLVAVRETEP